MEDDTQNLVNSKPADHKESNKCCSSKKISYQKHRRKRKKRRGLCRSLRSPHLHAVLGGVPLVISVAEIEYLHGKNSDVETEVQDQQSCHIQEITTACNEPYVEPCSDSQLSVYKNEDGEPAENNKCQNLINQPTILDENIHSRKTSLKHESLLAFCEPLTRRNSVSSSINSKKPETLNKPLKSNCIFAIKPENVISTAQLNSISLKITNLEEELIDLKKSIVHQEYTSENKFDSLNKELAKINKSLPLIKDLIMRKTNKRKTRKSTNGGNTGRNKKKNIGGKLCSKRELLFENRSSNVERKRDKLKPINNLYENINKEIFSDDSDSNFGPNECKYNQIRGKLNDISSKKEDNQPFNEFKILLSDRTWREAMACLFTPASIYEPSAQSLPKGTTKPPLPGGCHKTFLQEFGSSTSTLDPADQNLPMPGSTRYKESFEDNSNSDIPDSVILKLQKIKQEKIKEKKRSVRGMTLKENTDELNRRTIVVRLDLSSEKT